ncbi:uncharacterized protein MELLADRAFT_117018 [Melampsora larici-populina 98AG31]|uniref:ABC transporter n=1 Tax=Melampsora larici-populina (strain 98AG31 / pathotype 3-4-7) TaxID=747676 RepID=F4RSI3_MELLP|nr:uncharacterized protein MELLADRAFT_117018 [Melampsora larici-populina 98AG31]EGG04689.1 hypothetical protein MELLADRAFT_117018 [Melampsora larici-populina 98AG31]
MFSASLSTAALHESQHLFATSNDDVSARFEAQAFESSSSPTSEADYLDGLPAIFVLAVWVLNYVIPRLFTLYFYVRYSWLQSDRHTKSSSPEEAGLLASSDTVNRTSHGKNKSFAVSSNAVCEAEDQVIASELQQHEWRGVLEYIKSSPVIDLVDVERSTDPRWSHPRLKLFLAWKDWITTIGTIGLFCVGCLQFRHILLGSDSLNAAWLLPHVLMWGLASILSIVKLRLSMIRKQEHPGDTYSNLETLLIPTYLLFLPFAFYTARGAILVHLDHSSSSESLYLATLQEANFAILLLITGLELCSSRPTRLLPTRGLTSKTSQPSSVEVIPPPLEPRSSLLALAYYAHTDGYLWRHTFKTATQASIPDLRPDDKTAAVLFRWRHDQAEYAKLGIKPSLLRSLAWHLRYELLGQQFYAWFNAIGALLPPFFLQHILGFISAKAAGEDLPNHLGVLYAFGMLCTQVFLAFSQAEALFLGRRLSVRIRALFIALIFTKGLRRADTTPKSASSAETFPTQDATDGKNLKGKYDNEEGEGRASIGKIANLVSNDTMSLSEIGAYLQYDYNLTVIAKLERQLMRAADRRLGLTGEIINNIKIVKFFAWESKFTEKMSDLRDAELYILFKRLLVGLSQTAVSLAIPIFVSIATFYVHTEVMGQTLTAEQAFTAIALFNVFRFPLGVMAGMIGGLLKSYVALRRIDDFLNEDETEKYSTLSPPVEEEGDPLIGFKDAAFTYGAVPEDAKDMSGFQLRGLNFGFPVGKLSLVIGRVGSGKTSLLLSLLGETNKLSGRAFLPSPVARQSGLDPAETLTDTTAYAPQQPWLLSDTIRNNILFGSAMNLARYNAVIKACALVPDLLTFTDGDLTEIGDKGTVLSGGQKARISLARAVYSPAKFLLLDDIMSAVDSHTAQHLFNKVLKGSLMKNRTCVLVTHAVDLCFPGAAFVVSLDQGEVAYAGKPSLSKSASFLFEPKQHEIMEAESHKDQTIEELAGPSAEPAIALATKATQKLVEDEQQAVGAVSSTVYRLYFKALGGFFPIAFTLVLYFISELANAASSIVLKDWAGQTEGQTVGSTWNPGLYLFNPTVTITKISRESPDLLYWNRLEKDFTTQDIYAGRYLQWYTLAGLVTLAFQLFRQFYFTMQALKAARNIYDCLMRTVLNAKGDISYNDEYQQITEIHIYIVRFFDTVPMGRVLSRFTKDVQTMDRDLSDTLTYLINDIISASFILIVVVTVLPIGFLVASLVASSFYVLIGYIYLASTREIKRSESTTRSPVISLCTECLQGATSIRAYGDIGRFSHDMFRKIDQYNRPYFMLWICNRWLSSRIDVTAALFTFAVACWMILHNASAALSGFALSYVISFNFRTLWIVRWWGVNLERIHEYLDIDQEPKAGVIPPAAWPSRSGSIEVENLWVSYAPHLPKVLKGVSFNAQPGEKIGICGRTGSGKSTLALSFFRFIEASEGRIVIDGQDISKLDLPSLRSRLTIIPQESVLFTASIRWNLDPFDEHDDSKIWDALRRVGMAAPLGLVGDGPSGSRSGSPGGHEISYISSLDMEVEDNGRNFSTGQRQLLAIARALLKLQNSSVLILDESTASLDAESDERIQKTIRTEMSGATILCIAHRLKSIIEFDKVLVLGLGEVLEFGRPIDLLADKGSAFRELCGRSGNMEELLEMAKVASGGKVIN